MAAIQQNLLSYAPASSFPGTVFYVDTDVGAGGNGSLGSPWNHLRTATDVAGAAAIQAAYAGGPVLISCRGVTADNQNVTQVPWNALSPPSAASYLRVMGDNTTGIYNTSAYRLEVTNEHALYNNIPCWLQWVNLQAKVTSTDSGNHNCFRQTNANQSAGAIDCRVYNCIAVGNATSGTNNVTGYINSQPTSGGVGNTWNCIAQGCGTGFASAWSANRIMNCTAWGNRFNYVDAMVLINCLSANPLSGYGTGFISVGDGGGLSTNNSSDDDTAPGSSPDIDAVYTFVNSGAGNFQLTNASTGAKGLGATNPGSGLFLSDIVGTTRTVPWDIGAWKAQP